MSLASLPSITAARLLLTGSTALPKVGTQLNIPASGSSFSSPRPFPSHLGVKPTIFPIPILPRPSPRVKPLPRAAPAVQPHGKSRGSEPYMNTPRRPPMALTRVPRRSCAVPRSVPFPMPGAVLEASMRHARGEPVPNPFAFMNKPKHIELPYLRPGKGILKEPSSFSKGLSHARRVAFAGSALVVEFTDFSTVKELKFLFPVRSTELPEPVQEVPKISEILPGEADDVEYIEPIRRRPMLALLVLLFLFILATFLLEWIAGKCSNWLYSRRT
ncbi:hypothetical protein PENSTE_c002G09450 [Penicillium steckii]|uniref:Uncharacterized protein n=1 Tax=Penicillium steckii TaxID=303698 RepID=A0A1V6TV22_9EURO|nr:hypothetical protein PENSTE_c002G09450 [Penicillium steckii]